MKHLTKTLLIIAVLFISISCAEDEVNEFNASDIVGSWKLTDFHGTSTSVYSYNNNSYPDVNSVNEQNLTSNEEANDAIIVFNADNSYTSTGSIEIHSVVTTDGEVTLDDTYSSTPYPEGEWSINGDQLTITVDGGESTTATIISHTANTFTIKKTDHIEQDYGAATVVMDIEFFETFTRQ